MLERRGPPNSEEMNEIVLRLMEGVNANAFALFGDRVLTGPFTGMRVPLHSPWRDGNESTKLLGVYEHELHSVIDHAIWRRPESIVVVGCAEGYYAVGMARLCKESTVLAYDINDECLEACKEASNINGAWIECLKGINEPQMLPSGPERTLYIFDCEGTEEKLINLELCYNLRFSDMIIECHDFMKPGISLVIADRLSATHRVELIRPRLPDFSQFAFVKQCPSIMAVLMVVEKRPMPTYWLACWANQRRGNDG